MNAATSSVRAARKEARIKWLLAHRTKWNERTVRDRDSRRRLVDLMKEDGVVAPGTYYLDVGVGDDIIVALQREKAAAR